ncbi:MAG: energy transducer TonB [Bacteroidota bacterium]
MRTNLTDDEIKGYMNFDDVLNRHQAQRRSANRWIRNVTIAVTLGSVAILIYSLLPVEAPGNTNTSVSPKKPVTAVDSSEVRPSQKESQVSEQLQKQPSLARKEKVATQQKETQKANTAQPEIKHEPTVTSTPVQYLQAEPLKGYPDLYDYFGRELHYPADAVQDSIQGVVSVSFIINTNGRPEQIKIQNSLGSLFDTEAIRLIENMPDWKPAQLNGKAVPAKVALPLTFRLVTNEPR